jgi:hypothetical protein
VGQRGDFRKVVTETGTSPSRTNENTSKLEDMKAKKGEFFRGQRGSSSGTTAADHMKEADDRYSKDRNLKDLKQHQDERAAKTAEMRNQLTGADRAKDFGQVQQDNRSAAADKGLRTNDPITDQMKFIEGQNGKSASWTMDGDPPQPPLASITDGKSDADRAAAARKEADAARKEADAAYKTFLRTANAVRDARGTS